MKITVVGAGYVGLVTAACLAEMGHVVHLLEISRARVDLLRQGRLPFFEPDLDALVRASVAGDSLVPTDDEVAAFRETELVLICVGTPLAADGQSDLSQVREACRTAGRLGAGPIVVRSTLPLGSTGQLAGWLARPTTEGIVSNPEFLRQGSAVSDFRKPARIVIGTQDGSLTEAATTVRELYAPLGTPVLVTDYGSAEMIKNVANAFLAMRLSFVNEVADLCEAYGADIESVVTGIGLDPRIGSSYMRPGIGFGGSCLPKELANLVRLGQRRGLAMPLLESVGRVNDTRATRITDRIEEVLGAVHGKRIALLGLSFKPHTDDTRYSPSVALAARLADRGADVVAHDPVVSLAATAGDRLRRADTPADAIEGADLVVLATEWPEYRALPWDDLVTRSRSAILFDGRNALDHDDLRRAGWRVLSVGHAESPLQLVD